MSDKFDVKIINNLEEEVTRLSGGPLNIREFSPEYKPDKDFDIKELSKKAKAAAAVFAEMETIDEGTH